jgi:hypothetical protein
VTYGTAVASQTAKDCAEVVCDGTGNTTSIADDADVPVDGSACTQDLCSGGVPSNPPTPAGSACTGGGKVCDGSGACVACVAPTDCPGTDGPCATRACTAGACGTSYQPSGTPLPTQTSGDCKTAVCDGTGGTTTAVNDADLPIDGNACTKDLCAAGAPANPPTAAGTTCGSSGVCDGSGACAACTVASDCPGQDGECAHRTCASGTCGFAFAASGTPLLSQTAGDCRTATCDGKGGTSWTADDADVPQAGGTSCSSPSCSGGSPSVVSAARGTSCDGTESRFCDGAGTCRLAVHVVRIGSGAGGLTSSATAVFAEQWLTDGQAPLATLALPTATSGSNLPLTLSGTATSEGALSRSPDQHYVVVGGYAASVGTSSVASTSGSSTNRVVARISASGAIDTSTHTTLLSGNNIRGAATADGSAYWLTGASNGAVYVAHGSSGGTSILSTPGNTRAAGIFGGQLYVSSQSGSNVGINSVGTGTPTTSGHSAKLIASSANAYGFVLLDVKSGVAGVDTMYVADESSGVTKWTYDGTKWSLVGTYASGLGTAGVRGLAAAIDGSTVVLVATTTDPSKNRLVYGVDDGTNAVTFTTIATAPANTVYRGVAPSPR